LILSEFLTVTLAEVLLLAMFTLFALIAIAPLLRLVQPVLILILVPINEFLALEGSIKIFEIVNKQEVEGLVVLVAPGAVGQNLLQDVVALLVADHFSYQRELLVWTQMQDAHHDLVLPGYVLQHVLQQLGGVLTHHQGFD